MDEKLYNLAKLIKMMAKDVAKKDAWWKQENVSRAIGLYESDVYFDEISVTDDSGYRCITIGDTRGNISRVNGRLIVEEEHKGYMQLYREGDEFEYKCFPSVKEIYKKLKAIANKTVLDDKFSWYERTDEEALEYYAKVVKEHAEVLEKTGKTPREIFETCQ